MTRHFRPGDTVFHSNSRYAADAACEHCEKLGGHHEVWCITCNHRVLYARGVVEDAKTMTMQDNLILHALGVAWTCDSTHVHQRM
jgi:hypothetical protein